MKNELGRLASKNPGGFARWQLCVKSSIRSRALPLILIVSCISGCSRSINDIQKSPEISRSISAGPPLTVLPTDSPAGRDSREPNLTTTTDGKIILSWVEKVRGKRYALRFAMLKGDGWSTARTVGEGENWFINWADFPSVIALTDGSLAAHWLVKSGPGTYAYDVNVALSKDGGQTWGKPIVPHTDETQTEHGFVSLVPLPDSRLGVIWVDGRNLKDVKDVGDEHTPLSVSMSLRYAAIDSESRLSDEEQLDERICECCQTSAAITGEGIIAVYRDRSDKEVRDIYFVRKSNEEWTSPQAIHADNWEISGCPVNGPAVAAEDRHVVVAWYTEANDSPRVKAAFSNDAGESFGAPIEVDDGESLGRVDVLLLPDGSALVCWLSGTVEGGRIKVRRVRSDGSMDEPAVIVETSISRSSGFPRMARMGNEVYFAWTEFGDPSYVRVAKTTL